MRKITFLTTAIVIAMAAMACFGLAGCASSADNNAPVEQESASSAETDEEVLEGVLLNFEKLAAVPRPTHHEERIGAFLLQWAQEQGFDARQDEVGNVIFDIPATEGRESAPLTVLQAHMDMVAVSSDPNFDPLNTPITVVRGEDTLTADGTSLGADDGAGVATIMYYATSEAEHGPIRAIITVNEEDGMAGIKGLDASEVADATYLLNLDAETLGEAFVSSAATLATDVRQEPSRTAPTLDSAVAIELDGLLGGHSGLSIGSGHINAIKSMGQLLACLRQEGIAFELASLNGGTAANAIPSKASAVVTMDSQDIPRVEEIFAEQVESLASAHSASDPDVNVTVVRTDMPESVFEANQAADIVDFIAIVFDGVHTMSQSVDGLVESSSNLGVFQADDQNVSAMIRARSSQKALGESIALGQKLAAERCGFSVEQSTTSEAWPVDTESELQPLMQEIYRQMTGEELKLTSVHAGLECGGFELLNPDLDMISVGPEIHDVHSVDETLYLDSVVPFFRLVERTLDEISDGE